MPYNEYLHSDSTIHPDNDNDSTQQIHGHHHHNTYTASSVSNTHSLPLTFPEYDAPNAMGITPTTFSNQVQFQMPQFILGGPPSIPPGGGAEAITGMLPNPGSASLPANSWFLNDFVRYGSSSDLSNDSAYQASVDPSSTSSLYHQDHEDLINHNFTLPQSVSTTAQGVSSYPSPSTASSSHPPIFPLLASGQFNPTSPIDPSKVGIPSNVQPLLYSASGFDVLGILAKVATRSKPKIVLGPVDFTCSFCFVDVRRFDHPVVYASPTFYKLTGYSEHEVIGKNCRFLQSPDGMVERGAERKFTSPDAVQHLRKSLMANKECQASLINYRKGGQAFINLVTVIPVPGDDGDEIAYHVGFQVDLTEQPSAILQRLNDGSYIVNYSASVSQHASGGRERTRIISKELRYILSNGNPSPIPKPEQDRADLNNFLLENSDDFIHVLSLKGLFQYVSPSVRKILEYDAEELIGKSISDICHPADITPVIRELKESSMTVPPPSDAGPAVQSSLKTVDLLFRARTKTSGYVWIESHGRLHVEPGKGRKSIILSGRLRTVPRLSWKSVANAGGVSDREFWGLLSSHGLWLNISHTVSTVLGKPATSIAGTSLLDLVPIPQHQARVLQALDDASSLNAKGVVKVLVDLSSCNQVNRSAQLNLYPREEDAVVDSARLRRIAAPVVCQVKLMESNAETSGQLGPSKDFTPIATSSTSSIAGQQLPAVNLFEELDTTRHTSWQYELTNLKIANKNLLASIAELETQRGLRPEIPIEERPGEAGEAESTTTPRPSKRRRLSSDRNEDSRS